MMRGSTAILLPLVCLLVGLGAGYLLFSASAPSSGNSDSELLGDDPTDDRRGGVETTLRVATLEGRGTIDPLTSVVQAVPIPAAEAGTGVISGHVTDQAGTPVAGVRMTLTAQPDAGSYVRPAPKDDPEVALLKQLRWMIKNHRWGSAYRQVTATDEAGAYRFGGVTDRLHRIQALREGYQIYPRDHRQFRGVSPGATLDFAATAMARLRIELTGSAQPTILTVELRSSNGLTSMQWSASNPVVDCQPGTWDVHVIGGAQQELRGGPYPLVLEAGAEPQTLRVSLEARPVLRLHIQFAPDEVMPLYTYIMPSPPAGTPTAAALRARGKNDMRQWMHSTMLTATAKEQVQTFNDLEEGPYVVGIARDHNGTIVHMEEVMVRGGIHDHTLVVPPLDPDTYVLVAAYGPDGALVKRPSFSTGYRSDTGSSSGGSRTALRSDGRVLVMHQNAGEASGGTWWVDVTAPDLGSKRVEYVRGQARELRVEFQEPADVSIEVKGAKGTPYEGRVAVSLHPSQDGRGTGSGVGRGIKPDKRGRFLVRGLQPGEYRLSLSVQTGNQHSSTNVANVQYLVKPGSQQTAIALPPLFTLTVNGATRHVSLSSADRKSAFRSHQSQTADENGVAVFDALPAGRYRVRSGSGRADVTLPGPSAVTLTKRGR